MLLPDRSFSLNGASIVRCSTCRFLYRPGHSHRKICTRASVDDNTTPVKRVLNAASLSVPKSPSATRVLPERRGDTILFQVSRFFRSPRGPLVAAIISVSLWPLRRHSGVHHSGVDACGGGKSAGPAMHTPLSLLNKYSRVGSDVTTAVFPSELVLINLITSAKGIFH